MSRTNQPKFRPSLTVADMIDCISALQFYSPTAPVLNIMRQQVAKIAMTNPELLGSNASLKLNAIMHQHGSIAKAENPNSHINQANRTAHEAVESLGKPVFGDPAKYPTTEASEITAAFNELAREKGSEAMARNQVGYPDEQLPEEVRSEKEAAYIALIRSGSLSATADDYAFKVAVDTWMMDNKETLLPKLGITVEVLAMYCPLAYKPMLEI